MSEAPATSAARRGSAWILPVLILAGAFILASWAVLQWAALRGIPIQAGDNSFFSPVVHAVSTRGELVQPWVLFDGRHAFDWHGWLYPELMALFPWTGTYSTQGAAHLLLCGLVTGVFAVALLRRGLTIAAALAIVAMFAVSLFQIGRMELLTSLFLCLALPLAFRDRPGRLHHLLLVLLLALIAVTHPPFAFLCGLALAAGFAHWAEDWREFLKLCLGYAIGAGALTAVATELHPELSFLQWIDALRDQSNVIAEKVGGSFLYYNLVDQHYFGRILFWAAWPVLAWALWRRVGARPGPGARRLVLAAMFATGGALLWFIAGRVPEGGYNIMAFAPLILFALALLAREPWPGRLAAFAFLLLLAAAGAATIGYRVVVNVQTAMQDLTPAEMGEEIRLLAPRARSVGGSHTVAPYLAEMLPGARIIVWPRGDLGTDEALVQRLNQVRPELLVRTQAHHSQLDPPAVPGYRLILDRFNRRSPSVAGRAIGRTYKGFSFAAYCRIDVCERVAMPGSQEGAQAGS